MAQVSNRFDSEGTFCVKIEPVKVGSLLVYRLAVWSFDLYFLTRGGVRATGVENVPAKGGVLICPIHLSNIDPPALACTMRHRRLLALAKEELWDNRIFGWIIGQIGAFPIRRGEADREAIKYSADLLEDGQALLVFPEGTRGNGREIQPIQAGPAMLAKKTGVPVVPVGIVRTRKGDKGRVEVHYGPAFTFAEMPGDNDREKRAAFNERLAAEIQRLCAEGGLELART